MLLSLMVSAVVAVASPSGAFADTTQAVEAAKKYTRGRCTSRSPCRYRAERDGSRWRVWVTSPGRRGLNGRMEPGPTLALFFDREGNLTRRIEEP